MGFSRKSVFSLVIRLNRVVYSDTGESVKRGGATHGRLKDACRSALVLV